MDAHLHQPGDNLAEITDEDLLSLIGAGTAGAYAELYRRHRDGALTVASASLGATAARDAVDESFLSVLKTVLIGEPPSDDDDRTGDFAILLKQAVHDEVASRSAAQVGTAAHLGESEDLDPSLVAAALSSLPDNWQRILWLREVERLSPRSVADRLDIAPNAVTRLAVRARRGLQDAWLELQPSPADTDHECLRIIARLAEYSSGRISPPRRRSVRAHLDSCARCTVVATQITQFSLRCRSLLIPALLTSPTVIERLADTLAASVADPHLGTNGPALAAVTEPAEAAAAPAAAAPIDAAATESPKAAEAAAARERKRTLPKSILIPAVAAAIAVAATLLGFSFASPETEDTSYRSDADTPSAPAGPSSPGGEPDETEPATVPGDHPEPAVGTDDDHRTEPEETTDGTPSRADGSRNTGTAGTPSPQDPDREGERGELQEEPWIGPGPDEDPPSGRTPSGPSPDESPEAPSESPATEEPVTSPDPEPAPEPEPTPPAPDSPSEPTPSDETPSDSLEQGGTAPLT